jgi:acetyl esterase/lipase
VREELDEIPGGPPDSRFPRSHLWFPALMLAARSVRHERGIVYHREAKRIVRLDIYRARASEPDPEPRPAVVQVHGGGWILGSRVEQGIPLLNHLAANGWVGFNVDYRLSPRATLPDHVIDVKRAIAWIRRHAGELGVDPRRICITGGSAGAHLAALAALTADDETLQPGFEDADTSVAAAVPFYGIYDLLDSEERYFPGLRHWLLEEIVVKRERATDPDAFRRVSPTHRIHPGAPPFLVIHGEDDSLVPVADAREFAKRLEAISQNEVLYVQLPGAQHAFDLAPSLRTARMVEGIERFLRTVVATGDRSRERERELVA